MIILILGLAFNYYYLIVRKAGPLTKDDIVFFGLKPGDVFSESSQKKLGKLIRIDKQFFNAYTFPIFIYHDFKVKTYLHPYVSLGEKTNVYSCVTIFGKNVSTRRGLKVGDSLTELIKLYGKWDELDHLRYKYYIHHQDGTVDSYNGIYFDLTKDKKIKQIFIYGVTDKVLN